MTVTPCRCTSCGQLGQRDLHAVVDVDGVDVGIGAELERAMQRVAAVVAADALHVDHLVDADDLRLDRLGDGRIRPPRRRRRDRWSSPRPAAARCRDTARSGSTSSDSKPAIVVTMAMTIASRGRSTKMAENIASAPACRRTTGLARTAHAGPHALQSFDDRPARRPARPSSTTTSGAVRRRRP